jgi:ferredoxin-NADP reductase
MSTATPTRPAPAALRLLRRAAEVLAHPLVPEDYLALLDPLAGRELRARVVAIRAETADAATVALRPGRAWPAHRPGQYLRLGVDVDGVRQWRAYSITSPPHSPEVEICVKAMPGGVVSNHVVRALRPGAIVRLSPPEGEFVLPDPAPTSTLFLTGGSGITPVMGMLRTHQLSDAVVVHSALTREDVIFGEELRALARDGRIRLLERHTDADGLLDLAELDGAVPDWRDRQTWACGPAGLLAAAEAHWAGAGVAAHLRIERFRPLVAASDGDGGRVTFATSGRTAQAQGTTTLLEAGETAGVLMPHGCRMGICRGCVVPLLSGSVRDLRTGDTTTAVPGDAATYVQTCVSGAAGPCELGV